METNHIKIGGVYTAKVTKREVPVRIDAEHEDGGWAGTNLASGKAVRIKAASHLFREVTKKELKEGTAPGMDKKPIRRSRKKPRQTFSVCEYTSQPAKKSVKAASGKPKAKLSGLDAAYQVLCESDEPMNAKQIVETAAEKGYWQSDAATPHATVHAAISREIKNKGDESRFAKAGRGMFTARE